MDLKKKIDHQDINNFLPDNKTATTHGDSTTMPDENITPTLRSRGRPRKYTETLKERGIRIKAEGEAEKAKKAAEPKEKKETLKEKGIRIKAEREAELKKAAAESMIKNAARRPRKT